MQSFVCIGNLTKEPELTKTLSDKSVAHFTIAVNRNYGEREADFFNVTAWNKLAEAIVRNTHKGDKICVVGNIQLRTYEDNKGNKHTTVDLIAQEVEFLSNKTPKREDYDKNMPF